MSDIDLNGRHAFVTGASRGIGAATARVLAKRGAAVTLAARTIADCETIAREIEEEGGRALAVACDVASWPAVQDALRRAEAAIGPVDILVNNAGLIDPIARIADSDPDGWGTVVDVNLKGAYHAVRAVLPGMVERGTGLVVNISSGAANGAMEGWSHYCTTRAATKMLTACVHKEYADAGIRCVGLSPGTVATDMQREIKASGINPVSRLDWSTHIPPEWVGQAIAWLTTDGSRIYDGADFSLKTDEGRAAVGLPAL